MTNPADDELLSYWKDNKHDDYHVRQFDVPYRSTIKLAEFMRSILGDFSDQRSALDVCCGMGANIYYFQQKFPSVVWTGVDLVGEVLERGRSILAQKSAGPTPPKLMQGDAFALAATLPAKSFQIVTSMQSLLCMPDPVRAIDNLLDMCAPGGWVFLSSLFTDSWTDVRIEVTEYHKGEFNRPRGPALYNIFSIDKFRADCLARGTRRVEAVDFHLDIDIPPPQHKVMGTYTLALADRSKLQVSGPLLMPWKFVAIQAP